MKRIIAFFAALVMTAALFTGCAPKAPENTASPAVNTPAGAANTPESTPEATPEAPAAQGGGDIIVNLGAEPPMLDSIRTTSTGSMNVLRHVMDGLTMLDQNDVPVPAAAESWEVSEDKLTYTFKLRQGMKWSNGDEVTAKDFIFAWDTFFTAETASPYASVWAIMFVGATEKLEGKELSAENRQLLADLGYEGAVGYKAVDDYTIQLTLTAPYPYILDVLAFPNMFPMNERAYTEFGAEYATEADKIVTNGAWVISEWQHEDHITLERNPDYWDAANINVGSITMMMIADSTTALNAFTAQELDMVGLTGQQLQQLLSQGTPAEDILAYDDGSIWYFEFNNSLPGLKNPKIRKALTLGIDAQLFIDTIVLNDSKVSYSFVPPAISNGEFTAKAGQLIERVTNEDYTAVKALLEEGLAEENLTAADLKLSIITDESDTAAKNCAFFQEQWKTNLGVDVAIEQMTYKNRLERMENKDFSIVLAGWGPDYNDPMTFLDLFISNGGNNHTWYANPEYDRLIAEALVEGDAAKREQMLIDVEKIIATDYPIGPIYNRARNYICSEKLSGVVRTAFDDMNFRYAFALAQ